ncbi:MAG: PHP domain-containing protein [Dehalococcoidia bacterium]
MKVDLHIHTTASDGRLTPSEAVRRAVGLGLNVISITDHDSVGGIDEALAEARKFPDLTLIPGVEMGTDYPHGEMHILGYFVDHYSETFCRRLEMLRNSRTTRTQKMVSNLADMGIELNWEHVVRIAAGASIGRPHIAQAILERGYVTVLEEAFEKYIGDDSPAYVEREKLGPTETVELIMEAGGLSVLAHPARLENLDPVLAELKAAGLAGMEVYYKDYGPETVERLAETADRHGLIPCGGSDYHGFEEDGNEIGRSNVPAETVDRLIAAKRERSNLPPE